MLSTSIKCYHAKLYSQAYKLVGNSITAKIELLLNSAKNIYQIHHSPRIMKIFILEKFLLVEIFCI